MQPGRLWSWSQGLTQMSSQTWSRTRFSNQPTRKREKSNQTRCMLMVTLQGTQLERSYCGGLPAQTPTGGSPH